MRHFRRNCLLTYALVLGAGLSAAAQSGRPTSINTPDGDVAVPTTTGVLGTWDPAAVTEITSHLSALGTGSWTGLQATGQIVYGTKDPTAYPATLSSVGTTRYRLDQQTAAGQESIRIHFPIGRVQRTDGTVVPLPTTAVFAGLFPFAMPRLLRTSNQNMSLRDQGVVTLGTLQLHRVTLERPTLGKLPASKVPVTAAMDLYFDPITHLLVKTAAMVGTTDSRGQKLLSVVTYRNYQLVGATLIPFRMVQTLDGQVAATLQLSTVQLNPKLDDTNFQF